MNAISRNCFQTTLKIPNQQKKNKKPNPQMQTNKPPPCSTGNKPGCPTQLQGAAPEGYRSMDVIFSASPMQMSQTLVGDLKWPQIPMC